MPRIFINYRTGDGDQWAVTVERELSRRFGTRNVFRAAKSIRPGDRYDVELLRNVWRADALVAVIGPRWFTTRTGAADDWTSREITEALTHQVVVIPLLVNGAPRLADADLPPAMAGLARCQSVKLDHRTPDADLARLITRLAAIDGGPVETTEKPPPSNGQSGGIGSITGTTVNAVADAHGPVSFTNHGRAPHRACGEDPE